MKLRISVTFLEPTKMGSKLAVWLMRGLGKSGHREMQGCRVETMADPDSPNSVGAPASWERGELTECAADSF